MSKRRKETRVPLPYLPESIMEDIFHKMSYRAMARSKLVCKRWNSLISSPKFMDDYFNYRRLTEGNHLLIFDYDRWQRKSRIYGSSYSNLVKEKLSLSSMKLLDVKDAPTWSEPKILGSYNGLVAVAFEDRLILWNPLTRKQSSVNWYMPDRCDDGQKVLYGLCYDVGRDEYKVVTGSNYQSPPVSPSNFDRLEIFETIHVSLYNFKDGRGRALNRDSLSIRLLDKWFYIGKVVYGLPHWVVEFYDFIDPFVKKEILYFDLKDEKFKQIKRPYNNSDDKKLLGLAAIDDENQLGCVFRDGFRSSIEVWVMKEYGNSESWTNLFTIPSLYATVNHSSIMYMDVMGFRSNGELLLYVNGNRLWIYDFKKGNCHAIKFNDLKFDVVITYQPKLISPPEPSKHLNIEDDDPYYWQRVHIVEGSDHTVF